MSVEKKPSVAFGALCWIVLLLVVGGAVYYFFFSSSDEKTTQTKTTEQAAAPKNSESLEAVNSMPDINAYKDNTPERAFLEYMSSWKERDFSKMASFTQLSWKASEKEPINLLKSWFEGLTLQGVKITNTKKVQSEILKNAAYDIEAIATIKNHDGKVKTKTFIIRVVPENNKNEVDPAGRFGVNPPSGLNLFKDLG